MPSSLAISPHFHGVIVVSIEKLVIGSNLAQLRDDKRAVIFPNQPRELQSPCSASFNRWKCWRRTSCKLTGCDPIMGGSSARDIPAMGP